MEARVNLTTSIRKGLIKEVKSLPADFLLLHGSKDYSASARCECLFYIQLISIEPKLEISAFPTCIRQAHDIVKHCLKKAPEECTVGSVGRHMRTHHTYLYSQKLKGQAIYMRYF